MIMVVSSGLKCVFFCPNLEQFVMCDETSDTEEYNCPEDHAYLAECTCEHEPERHGWSECKVEGCNCVGHWEY